jgi:ZIP family zinc transporter
VSGAFSWGALAASSLLIGGLIVMWRPVRRRTLGLVMAFGAGVLISAVAYELVAEALDTGGEYWPVAVGLAIGALTFYVGDLYIDRMGGERRKSPDQEEGGSSLALMLGIVLAATTGLEKSGRSRGWILGLWLLIVGVSGLASLAGYGLFDGAGDRAVAFVLAFAGGAVLTMLADTMMPEAFNYGGKLVGLVTTFGFAVAAAIVALEHA